jgi:hypothetical protein
VVIGTVILKFSSRNKQGPREDPILSFISDLWHPAISQSLKHEKKTIKGEVLWRRVAGGYNTIIVSSLGAIEARLLFGQRTRQAFTAYLGESRPIVKLEDLPLRRAE